MRHEYFEWDSKKAAANLIKHRVSFEDAAAVLSDWFAERFHIEEFDQANSTETEDRWITIGSFSFDRGRVVVISWTSRPNETGGIITRIISARAATRTERKDYEEYTRQ
jgi:uncharacterized DUF497 family protein